MLVTQGLKGSRSMLRKACLDFDIRGICELYRRALDVPKSNWLEVVTSNYLIQSPCSSFFIYKGITREYTSTIKL